MSEAELRVVREVGGDVNALGGLVGVDPRTDYGLPGRNESEGSMIFPVESRAPTCNIGSRRDWTAWKLIMLGTRHYRLDIRSSVASQSGTTSIKALKAMLYEPGYCTKLMYRFINSGNLSGRGRTGKGILPNMPSFCF